MSRQCLPEACGGHISKQAVAFWVVMVVVGLTAQGNDIAAFAGYAINSGRHPHISLTSHLSFIHFGHSSTEMTCMYVTCT